MWRIFHGSSSRAHAHSGSSSSASIRQAPYDPEQAMPGPGIRAQEPSAAHGPLSPSSSHTSHAFNLDVPDRPPSSSMSSGAAFIAFLFLMLVITLLPTSFFLWVFVGLLLAGCIRALLTPQQRRPRPPPAAALTSPRVARVSRIPDNSAWVIFHRDQPVSLDALNAQLSAISRDFNSAAFSPRSGSEQPPRHDPAADTLSDSDISTFPVHQHRRTARHQRAAAVQQQQGGGYQEASWFGTAAGPSEGGRGAAAFKFRRDGRASSSGEHAPELQPRRSANATPGRAAAAGSLSPRPGAAAASALLGREDSEEDSHAPVAAAPGEPGPWTCVVCLDSYREGEVIMTLPCMHHFHQACLVPWLRHQGRRTACPMCKTPCFS